VKLNGIRGEIIGLCTFTAVVYSIALYLNPHYPAMVLAGEASTSTWMSGILLGGCAIISMLIAMQGSRKWFYAAVFFALLTLDEHFMFHESIKERIVFDSRGSASRMIYESPVLLGAVAGLGVAVMLWRLVNRSSRWFLAAAIALGLISVILDVFALGVIPEDIFKVLAELMLTCGLLLTAVKKDP
jgi:hypothetical protein